MTKPDPASPLALGEPVPCAVRDFEGAELHDHPAVNKCPQCGNCRVISTPKNSDGQSYSHHMAEEQPLTKEGQAMICNLLSREGSDGPCKTCDDNEFVCECDSNNIQPNDRCGPCPDCSVPSSLETPS